jgi:hypothetical protein
LPVRRRPRRAPKSSSPGGGRTRPRPTTWRRFASTAAISSSADPDAT